MGQSCDNSPERLAQEVTGDHCPMGSRTGAWQSVLGTCSTDAKGCESQY